MNKNYLIIAALLVGFIFGGAVGYYSKQSNYKYYYPPSSYSDPRLTSGLSCESIISSSLLVNKQEENKTIQGNIEKGTDKIAVKLNGDKLSFLTQAAVGAGVAEAPGLQVIQNTSKYLVAYGEFPFGGMDTFVLNRETGKAIWSKTQPNYLVANDVENQSFLFNCY